MRHSRQSDTVNRRTAAPPTFHTFHARVGVGLEDGHQRVSGRNGRHSWDLDVMELSSVWK